MDFRPEDVRSFLKVLAADPEAREEFARLVLPHELLALTERVDRLAGQMEALTERVDRLAGQIETLTARVEALTEQMQALTSQVEVLTNHVGELRGLSFEHDYWFRPARFQGVAQAPKPLSAEARDELLRAAVREGHLTREEAAEVYAADLVLSGRRWVDDAEVVLVVEVSAVVDAGDVERVMRRAALVRKAGKLVSPVVAGARVTLPAVDLARGNGVWQITDGKAVSPEP